MTRAKINAKPTSKTFIERDQKLPVINYSLKFNEPLYAAICQQADKLDKSINDVVIELVAKGLGVPELGYTPRKRMGRPRKPYPVKI